jgi:hypothetical protein
MRKSPRKRAPLQCRKPHVPNALTAKVLADTKAGKNLKHFATREELYADLGM